MNTPPSHRDAFTLIELLVVISIIALISSVALASLNAAREKARIAAGLQFASQVGRTAGDQAVGIWDFDENTGSTAVDRSGFSNDGNFTGAAWSASTPSGRGYAGNFNGTSAYVNVPDSDLLDLGYGNSMTISLWYYSTSNSGNRFLIAKRDSDNSAVTDYTILTTGGSILWGTSAASDSCGWWLTPEPSLNAWHHLAAVLSSSGPQTGTKQLYIDGKLAASCTYAAKNPAVSTALFIGKAVGASGYWSGMIDEVRIFAKALTAAEAGNLYTQGLETLRLAEGSVIRNQ